MQVGLATKSASELQFTFGHEVAHILGADHDRTALGGRTPTTPYSTGYLMTTTDKRTILAYVGSLAVHYLGCSLTPRHNLALFVHF